MIRAKSTIVVHDSGFQNANFEFSQLGDNVCNYLILCALKKMTIRPSASIYYASK